ncbi:hypothetical protein K9L27_02155 [Candidatus Gracilibacteria bacterium]|nr:hypothetical protein [Candidatus Gracilibacteria bacterium]
MENFRTVSTTPSIKEISLSELMPVKKNFILLFFRKGNIRTDLGTNKTLIYYLNEFMEADPGEHEIMLNWLPMDLDEKIKQLLQDFSNFCKESETFRYLKSPNKESILSDFGKNTLDLVDKIVNSSNQEDITKNNKVSTGIKKTKSFEDWLENFLEQDMEEVLSETPTNLKSHVRGLKRMDIKSRLKWIARDEDTSKVVKNFYEKRYGN